MQVCIPLRLLGTAAFSTCPQCRLPRRNSSPGQYNPSGNSSSKRASKRQRPSPSEDLIDSIDSLGLHGALPHTRPKPNLSYTSPFSDTIPSSRYNSVVRHHTGFVGQSSPAFSRLQHVLAFAIRNQHISHTDLPKQARRVLGLRNYSFSDVQTWASVLTKRRLNDAAESLRLSTLPHSGRRPSSRPIPVFVLLFLLRRKPGQVSPSAVRSLLSVAQHELHRRKASLALAHRPLGEHSELTRHFRLEYPVVEKDTLFLIIVRLLRFSRYSWPEALPAIASLFVQTFSVPNPQSPSPSAFSRRDLNSHHTRLARLALYCNKLLALVSLPSSKAPFRNVVHYRAAQFVILDFMATHNPPIFVSRSGYRAVINVSLASIKTDREREWDLLKAKSWPPWKEEKTGLDADKDPEYGLPKSLKAMRQLAQSGYPLQLWESIAQILAGWDLDGSPTIQTRSLLLHKHNLSYSIRREDDNNPLIWAARIKATRTQQEAWAAFVAHKDRAFAPSEHVYYAMFEKLVAPIVEPFELDDPLDFMAAGDANVNFPIPISPKEQVYVRLPIPGLHQLANEMILDNVYPSYKTLALLLSNAQDLDQATEYIHYASKRNPEVTSLLSDAPQHDQLKLIPRPVVSTFVALLLNTGKHISQWEINPSHHAHRLLEAYQLRDIALYNQFMKNTVQVRLAELNEKTKEYLRVHNRSSVLESRLLDAATRIRVFEELDGIVQKMEADGIQADTETLRLQCKALSSLILATHELLCNPLSQNYLRHSHAELMGRIETEHAPRLFVLFDQLFHGESGRPLSGPTSESSDPDVLPRLLTEPTPGVLHQYIRVLGFLHSHKMIVGIAEWMSNHHQEINAAVASNRRGNKTMLIKCLIALRAFTERRWENASQLDGEHENHEMNWWGGDQWNSPTPSDTDIETAGPGRAWDDHDIPSEDVQTKLRHFVELAGWEWPSDDMVEDYARHVNFVPISRQIF